MAKALGRSRSKLGLTSQPSFLLVFLRGLKTLPKGKQSSPSRKEKYFFFFFFLLLSTELANCCELNGGGGIWTRVLFLSRKFYPTASSSKTGHFFGLSISAEWSGKELRQVGVLPHNSGVYSEQPPKTSSCRSCSHFSSLSDAFLGQKRSNHRAVWSSARRQPCRWTSH